MGNDEYYYGIRGKLQIFSKKLLSIVNHFNKKLKPFQNPRSALV